MDRPATLLTLARNLAAEDPTFQSVRGPGAGNKATNAYMAALRGRAAEAFGEDCAERPLCGDTDLCVDFYFPERSTIIEIALGLPNPHTEFEKDILKALLAREHGHAVDRLWFISRPGAVEKCDQPGRRAVIAWARSRHALSIDVHELGGERRPKRTRVRLKPIDIAGAEVK